MPFRRHIALLALAIVLAVTVPAQAFFHFGQGIGIPQSSQALEATPGNCLLGIPGVCLRATTGSTILVACNASIQNGITAAGAGGTVQLAGSAGSPCTYSNQTFHGAANVVIQGDLSSPTGANTILDGTGVSASTPLTNGYTDSVSGVTLRNVTVQHYTGVHTAGCSLNQLVTYDGWLLTQDTFQGAGCNGVDLKGQATLSNSLVTANGTEGVFSEPGYSATSTAVQTITGNEISWNGSPDSLGNNAAGLKSVPSACAESAVATQGTVINANYVHNNTGVGIWWDCWSGSPTAKNNTVIANSAAGIMCEISINCDIEDNVVKLNNTGSSLNQGDIFVASSSNATVANNFVEVGNSPNIGTGVGRGLNIAGAGGWGDLSGLTGPQITTVVNDLKALGVQWVRQFLTADVIDPTCAGDTNLAYNDAWITAVHAAGIKIQINLRNAPTCMNGSATKTDGPTTSSGRTFWAASAAGIATRYGTSGTAVAGGVQAIAIWDEPDGGTLWTPTPNASDYTALVQASYTAIKAADSRMLVVAGELNSQSFLAQMYAAGVHGSADVIGAHPYCNGAPIGSPPCSGLRISYDTTGYPGTGATCASAGSPTTCTLQNIMAEGGDSTVPLWWDEIGEDVGVNGSGGYTATTAAQQAADLTTIYGLANSNNIAAVFWWNYQDTLNGTCSAWADYLECAGLEAYSALPTGNPRASYTAYQASYGHNGGPIVQAQCRNDVPNSEYNDNVYQNTVVFDGFTSAQGVSGQIDSTNLGANCASDLFPVSWIYYGAWSNSYYSPLSTSPHWTGNALGYGTNKTLAQIQAGPYGNDLGSTVSTSSPPTAAGCTTIGCTSSGWPTSPPVANNTYFISPTGSDSNNCLTTGTACATPNGVVTQVASLKCGDTISAAAGTYSFALTSMPSCPGRNNVVMVKCATFVACSDAAGGASPLLIEASYWGVSGWLETSATQACVLIEPPTNGTIGTIAVVGNVINGCDRGGIVSFPNGSGGASNFVVQGNAVYNAAQSVHNTDCNSGISMGEQNGTFIPTNDEIDVEWNFSWGNVASTTCSTNADQTGIAFDTWNFYPGQGIARNNWLIWNGGPGLELTSGGSGSNDGPVAFQYNTMAHNQQYSGLASGSAFDMMTTDDSAGSFEMTADHNLVDASTGIGVWVSPLSGPPYSIIDDNWLYSAGAGHHGTNYWGGTSQCFSGHTCNTPGSGGTLCGSATNQGNGGCSGNSFTTDPALVSTAKPTAPSCSGQTDPLACMASAIANLVSTAVGSTAYGAQVAAPTDAFNANSFVCHVYHEMPATMFVAGGGLIPNRC